MFTKSRVHLVIVGSLAQQRRRFTDGESQIRTGFREQSVPPAGVNVVYRRWSCASAHAIELREVLSEHFLTACGRTREDEADELLEEAHLLVVALEARLQVAHFAPPLVA